MSVFKRWNGEQWEIIGPEISSTRFDNINNMIAPVYNPNKTYNIGDYVIQGDKLYKCIIKIEVKESWNPEKWIEIKLGEDVSKLRNNIVQVNKNRPTDNDNKIWVKPDDNYLTIPLLEDVMALPNINDYGQNGQYPRSTGNGIEWTDFGLPSDEQTATAISNWLNNHPEATTTVEDHSLTYEKFINGTLGYVTPEMFGAYGDGVNDHNDSDAIQYAINTGKTVEFAPKTYICYSLTVSTPAVLHGNGATLKRPELDIAPYNMTVAQMKWIRTIAVSEDCTIDGLTFDNNCFTMWQVSDGYAQEQSSSVFVSNDTKKIKFNIDNCHFKNSASDGLHIVVNVVANISNCTSEDCFRGGFVSTGYGSEINLNGWDSKVITPGVNDGFDIEVDSPSTVDDQCYKVNINNVILDYDLDIAIPSYGQCTMSNIVMREFDQDTQGGASLRCNNGSLIVSNSVLRTGKLGNVQTYVHNDAVIILDSCRIYGNSIEACLKVTQYQETTYNSKLLINNCNVSCYDFIQCGNFCGEISINNCNIECSHWCLAPNGPSIPQFSTGFIIQNSFVKFADRFLQVGRNQYAPNGKSKFYLSNLHLTGASGSEIYVSGSPDVYYNNLVMESALILTKAPGASPKFYGDKRVIIVDSSADLTFAGWVAGNDIAITRDTGARYQYTSGTNWTAL